MSELRAGVYKHYKGGLYLALGVATHSETQEKLVAYVQLSGQEGSKIWVRPYDMFFEEITNSQGRRVPRFDYIGETIDPLVGKWYDGKSGYTGADRVDD